MEDSAHPADHEHLANGAHLQTLPTPWGWTVTPTGQIQQQRPCISSFSSSGKISDSIMSGSNNFVEPLYYAHFERFVKKNPAVSPKQKHLGLHAFKIPASAL
jgi:hypothetical protein